MTTETPVFTRYLYELNDVKYSLFVEMLNRNYDKVLFWTYELYYSGWSDAAFEWALIIYDKYYRVYDPRFELFIQKQIQYYNDIRPENASNDTSVVIEPDACIGNIFINMMYITTTTNKKSKKLRVILRPENIQKYLPTFADNEMVQPRKIMAQRCIYGVHKPPLGEHVQMLGLVSIPISRNMLNNWVYWASFSPIWGERIEERDGKVNHETSAVEFSTEDCYEEFYDKYGYEPDEQSNEIRRKCGMETFILT